MMAAGFKTKKNHQEITSSLNTLIQHIKTKEAWAWANNEISMRDIVNDKAKIEQHESDFVQVFLSSDIAHVKKKLYSSAELTACLTHMVSTLDPLLAEARKHVNKLQRMHAEHLKGE